MTKEWGLIESSLFVSPQCHSNSVSSRLPYFCGESCEVEFKTQSCKNSRHAKLPYNSARGDSSSRARGINGESLYSLCGGSIVSRHTNQFSLFLKQPCLNNYILLLRMVKEQSIVRFDFIFISNMTCLSKSLHQTYFWWGRLIYGCKQQLFCMNPKLEGCAPQSSNMADCVLPCRLL